MDRPMYHEHSRALQDRFDSRRIADALAQKILRQRFTDEDRAFIARQRLFFLATADAQGRPDCSHKGGAPGFVRVVEEDTLAFPSYDGNGMFKSLGNLAANPSVGLLFIDFEQPKRLRVNGVASLHLDDPLLAAYPGAQAIVRVRAEQIFPNCPRYIPRLQLVEESPYVPAAGCTPPVPAWKKRPEFNPALPASDPARD
ncbi:MAG TPA: pyridoxamine 5'-phosphate oxidase family protein [Burkholderiales bacterium]|nr:pyridoxamine 5'-phosphate oxidase family protein [Burkholderiales bacterium]